MLNYEVTLLYSLADSLTSPRISVLGRLGGDLDEVLSRISQTILVFLLNLIINPFEFKQGLPFFT